MPAPQATHPRKDDQGKTVVLARPHTPSPAEHWHARDRVATFIPDGAVPETLNGIAIARWRDAPTVSQEWWRLAEPRWFQEPAFDAQGKTPAAGAVVLEPDGRVWLVAPTNAFGGVVTTFPKAVATANTLRAAALEAALEKAGLRIILTDHLLDQTRTTTRTRYYLARRIGGSPADMGWRSQAVLLAPRPRLPGALDQPLDHAIVAALEAHQAKREGIPTHAEPGLHSEHHVPSQAQLEFAADLIDDMERACVSAFGVRSAAELRWEYDQKPTPWDVPEVMRFIKGLMACGLTFGPYDFDDLLDLAAIDAHPAETLGAMEFPELRRYLHTLHRADKWADAYSSPILASLASGALQRAARRLRDPRMLSDASQP